MSALPERRTRPTIRCLRDDLGIERPTIDVDVGSLEHPLVEEARRIAPAAPRGQKRITRCSWRCTRPGSHFRPTTIANAMCSSARAADGGYVAEGLRDLLFAIVFDAAGAETGS